MFGPWSEEKNEIGPFLQASRYLQMESLRYAVEATRRREPQASGFIVWMGNEPYPNNANTSLILPRVVNNNRFLIVPWVHISH